LIDTIKFYIDIMSRKNLHVENLIFSNSQIKNVTLLLKDNVENAQFINLMICNNTFSDNNNSINIGLINFDNISKFLLS
jgi:hypothetical protein